ncbi:MAG: NACHT domain-containing protein [Desulfobacteraceae bacterium]|nr:NACHT domain-containing protein [Desulfobacteraceae bacterium]MBC2750108.1 NACHT domain-containing protein [Desulfobacteraceae bacterium]
MIPPEVSIGVQETLLSNLIQEAVKEAFSRAKEIFKGIKNENQNEIHNKISKYLNDQKQKHAYIKTLLHRAKPTYLYRIYYPLRIIHEKYDTETNSLAKVFELSNFLAISGDAGCGKSTLLKHLFLRTLAEKQKIPIFIELRYVKEGKEYLIENLVRKALAIEEGQNYRLLLRLLDFGGFVFFIDGFDEVGSEYRNDVLREIGEFVARYNNNQYVITSRPFTSMEYMPRFFNFQIKKLEREDIDKFITKQLEDGELSSKIIQSIKETKLQYVKSFLSNPLFLTLYILAYQNNASVPERQHVFYQRVIEALFTTHDSHTKTGYCRERVCDLNQEEIEFVLKRFSFLSFYDGKYTFNRRYVDTQFEKIKSKSDNLKFNNADLIDDCKVGIAIWIEDAGEFSFSHRSLQEYYACIYIKELRLDLKKKLFRKILKDENLLSRDAHFYRLLNEVDEYHVKNFLYYPLIMTMKEEMQYIEDSGEYENIFSLVVNFISFSFVGKEPTVGSFILTPFYMRFPFLFGSFLFASTLSGGIEHVLSGMRIDQVEEFRQVEPVPGDSDKFMADWESIIKIEECKKRARIEGARLHKELGGKVLFTENHLLEFINGFQKAEEDLIDMI